VAPYGVLGCKLEYIFSGGTTMQLHAGKRMGLFVCLPPSHPAPALDLDLAYCGSGGPCLVVVCLEFLFEVLLSSVRPSPYSRYVHV